MKKFKIKKVLVVGIISLGFILCFMFTTNLSAATKEYCNSCNSKHVRGKHYCTSCKSYHKKNKHIKVYCTTCDRTYKKGYHVKEYCNTCGESHKNNHHTNDSGHHGSRHH